MLYFQKKRPSSGIFVPASGGFVEFTGDSGNGSINGIIEALGYHIDQVYTPYFSYAPKEKIQGIYFELFSRNIVFIHASQTATYITYKEIKKFLGDFSVTKEFDRLKIDDVLTAGIENASLSASFLSEVLKLKDISNNGLFFAERIKTFLYFTGGLLTDFHFDDGFFPYSNHLKLVNPTIYKWLSGTAYKYWPNNDFQAKKEINIQSEAWSAIDGAFGNEFVPLHRTENGGANLHMIRVCHYGHPISINQFKEINHGRFTTVENSTNQGQLIYKCGRFVYTFDNQTEQLINSQLIE